MLSEDNCSVEYWVTSRDLNLGRREKEKKKGKITS